MAETPREIKVSYSKKSALWMTAVIALFLCVCNFLKLDFFEELEYKTIDFRFSVRGERKPEAPIRILAVDEKSLREVGQWPWPRAIHAKLVRKLKDLGVKCVFFDVFFPEPERTQEKMLNQLESVMNSAIQGSSPTAAKIRKSVLADVQKFQSTQNGDKEFGQAIQDCGNVFLPIEPLINGKEGRTPNPESLHLTGAQLFHGFSDSFFPSQSLIISIPDLQEKVEDSGHTRFFPNKDGIVRFYPTVIAYSGLMIPHLSLQVARVFLGEKNPIKVFVGDHVEVGNRNIPILDEGGSAVVDYCGSKGIFPTFSASDLLNDRADPKDFKGSIVLIGATAEGINDLRPTPFTKVSPGVEINANIIENVLDNHVLTLAPDFLKYILVLILSLAIWYMVPRVTPTQGSLWFGALLVVYIVVACLAFQYAGLIINMTYPVLSLMLTFLFLTTYKFRTEVRHSRYMKQMFQSMVTPKVVEEILKMPAGIELGGEEKELTVMFSDIRGFTTYSEKHTPHEVVGILNEYLTQMTNMIFQTEGTLDKYIGDAIMAFWGAPTSQKDHAYRACSTALGMVDLLHHTLHTKWESEGKEKLHIGIGINTGPIVVGFVGSQAIKNYTLIGDAVNLGSRLEGTTKEYKVEIIIGEQTYEHVRMDMLCRELDLIRVKGKLQPIRIYEVIDHRLKAAGAKELKVNAFQEGLSYYRLQRWDDAIKRFRVCLELDPEDGPSKIFIDRCENLKEEPPPADWDGVFIMKTK